MRYWKSRTVVKAPWSSAAPSPVFFLLAMLTVPSASPAETLVDAYYKSTKVIAPAPEPAPTFQTGWGHARRDLPQTSTDPVYQRGYESGVRLNAKLDQRAVVTSQYTAAPCPDGRCRVYARVTPAAAARQLATPSRAGQHAHRCGACGTEFWHSSGSHNCPSCGRGPWYAITKYGPGATRQSSTRRGLFGLRR